MKEKRLVNIRLGSATSTASNHHFECMEWVTDNTINARLWDTRVSRSW